MVMLRCSLDTMRRYTRVNWQYETAAWDRVLNGRHNFMSRLHNNTDDINP